MHYSDGAQWRPLFEDGSTHVQVATGCSHNRCRFCDMYREPFSASPAAEVEADIRELAGRTGAGQVTRLFLAGGNSFCLPAQRLLATMRQAFDTLPALESVGAFARVTDIAAKSDAELTELAAGGMGLIAIGAESGLDSALERMEKGFRAADIVEQCRRLDKAGMRYALFYLAGMAGADAWIENARATADVFGQANPAIVMVHTMTAFPGTPLFADIESGAFAPACEKDVQREMREFYRLFPKRTTVLADHFSNTVAFTAELPAERTEVLALMDERIARDDEDALHERRRAMTSI